MLLSSEKQPVLFRKYKNREIYKFFNLVVLIVKQYIFSRKYKSNANPNIHELKTVIIERLLIKKYMLMNCRYMYKKDESYRKNM